MTPHVAGARNTASSLFTGLGHHNPHTWGEGGGAFCGHRLFTFSAASLTIYSHACHWSDFLAASTLHVSFSWKHSRTKSVPVFQATAWKMRCAPFHRDTGGIPGKVGRVTSSGSCLTGNSTTGVSFSTQDYTKSIQLLSHLWVRSPAFAASSRKDKMWFQKF